MTSSEVYNSYFTLLEDTLREYDLIDEPAQLYNCDESGMPLEHKMPKIVTLKGSKKVRQINSNNRTQITVIACFNAAGQSIPPMVIFTGKKFNHDLSIGEVPGTLYGMADSGWMDQELFFNWFTNHFLKHAVSARPLLLLLDGHSSHFTLELVQEARKNNVIIFCLPPHTTADTQHLDTTCFAPLKRHWSQACRDFMFNNPARVVTKFQFSRLFASAWSKGMTISNVTSAFRNTGQKLLDKLPVSTLGVNCDNDLPTLASSPCCNDDVQPFVESGGCTKLLAKNASDSNVLSADQIIVFEKRWENGYDIFTNPEYVAWLQEYHPDDAPSLSSLFASVSPLEHTGTFYIICMAIARSAAIILCCS